MIYHNTKQKIFYYPIYRCGSSIIRDISYRCDELIEYQDDEGFKIIDLNRECPIYIIYRDPDTRFKSGLQITFKRFMLNNKELILDTTEKLLEDGYDIKFESSMAFLDNVTTSDIPGVSGFWNGKVIRPYHLYDSHLDHMLWRPLILKAYGYNVIAMPINEYDKHLVSLYPKALNEVLKSHDRPETFKSNNNKTLKLWNIYKKVFIDNHHFVNKTGRPVVSFKDWMYEERKAFNVIETFKNQKNFQFACVKTIKKLFEGNVYFQDIYSPSVDRVYQLLNILHNHKEPIKEFSPFYKSYDGIKKKINEYQSGRYMREK